MAWSYMPDYVRYTSLGNFGTMCRGTNSKNTLVVCEPGDPPFFASGFNGLYYNPAIRYMWPTKADGTRLPDHKGNTAYVAPWSAVPSDGYGVQMIDDTSAEQPSATPCKGVVSGGNCPRLSKTATVNLVTGYPERVWCNSEKQCKQALEKGAYTYPSGDYTTLYSKDGAPYYYNVSVEWCKTSDGAPNQNFGKAGTCQAKKTDTYKYVRYYNWSRVDITPPRRSRSRPRAVAIVPAPPVPIRRRCRTLPPGSPGTAPVPR